MSGEPRFEPGWDAQPAAVLASFAEGPLMGVLRDTDMERGVFLFEPLAQGHALRLGTHRVDELADSLRNAVWLAERDGPAAFADQDHRFLALPIAPSPGERPSTLDLVWGVVEIDGGRAISIPVNLPGWKAKLFSLYRLVEPDTDDEWSRR